MTQEEKQAGMLAHELENLAFKKEEKGEFKECQFYFHLAFKIRMHLIERNMK